QILTIMSVGEEAADGFYLSESEYESLITQLQEIIKEIKETKLSLLEATDEREILTLQDDFLTSQKKEIEGKCKALGVAKDVLEREIIKYLSHMVNGRCVTDASYKNVNKMLDYQQTVVSSIGTSMPEDIKLKHNSLKEDIRRLEEEKQQLEEQVQDFEKKWEDLDPSTTEVDVRSQVERILVKSNRNARNQLAILKYKHRVDVQGRILCHKRPLKNITIELMEGDVFSDDILNRTQTDKDGYFNLYGQDEEFTIIEPYIKINHFCSIYNKTEEANSTMFLYLPDTVMNSYNHYSNSYLQGVKVEGRILCKKTPMKISSLTMYWQKGQPIKMDILYYYNFGEIDLYNFINDLYQFPKKYV
uniref:Uncharacterized protein n=1 Tax=Strongyloides stercoralis TaxID=6248 RepID=A0AAF5DEP0_STRER